jgi:protein-S-isoprenylcysteine O-methyltransferase Ste14
VIVLTAIGRDLFRYRAVIGTVAFVLLALAAVPVHSPAGHVCVLLGLAVRTWAAGYIGVDARERKFGGEYVITNGPYRLLKHPLYIGNFFLVAGVLLLFNPPFWMGLLYVILYVSMYGAILFSEVEYMKGKTARETNFNLKNLRGEVSTWVVVLVVYAGYFLLLGLNRGTVTRS